jgi:crotonobetainyl-CoA:carnitine CoA-transferase CaiB-like acyl-CoA transferase
MPGVLTGVKVLDLSWGIAGPMAGMLLSDHGADVTKIEPPGGDPYRALSGARVWHRGKRSAVLDLTAERALFLQLVADADVLVESFSPGVTDRLGIDFATLHAHNPALVYCSITAYGRGTRHADRPGYDALVAARTGMQWEQRGWRGGAIARMSNGAPNLPDLEPPDGCWDGTDRPGPLFPYSTWPSLAAAFLATVGISAALRAREVTGRGQWVETSLLQGVLVATWGAWQRAERPDAPGYDTWIFDSRTTRGLFECGDGQWVCQWVPNPAFALGASEGDELRVTSDTRAPRADPTRISPSPEEIVVLHHYYPLMADAYRKFPAGEWLRLAEEVGIAMQPIRSPEEALADPALLADGCVAVVDDPDLGPTRQVGITYRLSAAPTSVRGPAPRVGEHDDEVRGEAATGPTRDHPRSTGRALAAPLAGVRVVDLGLAVAGPFGTQLLGDLGADVIKVNALHDGYWHSTHIAMACNRGKRSLAVNLKDERGIEALRRLVATADIVQHNMRYDAATRLGVDYESLKQIKPSLIYCHTRGFEHGHRESLPGNDQTGAALAGVMWEDGGMAAGGRPMWSLTSLGDLGNGFLSAIGMLQALYHRDRTGEGQFVDTSILNACLLNSSYAWLTADSTRAADRPHLDAQQLGITALYRLYETADGWLCLAAMTDTHWEHLCTALGRDDLGGDERLATAAGRLAHDGELWSTLEVTFATRRAAEWFEILDAAGVPCEISDDTFALGVFDDPELIERGWVTSYEQRLVGRLDQAGLLVDFSETPGRIAGPPLVVGDGTREILREIGYDDGHIDALVADGVVHEANP